MSGPTFIPGAAPVTRIVIPTLSSSQETPPVNTSPKNGGKSRVKNTPRRGKPLTASRLAIPRESSVNTEASGNSPSLSRRGRPPLSSSNPSKSPQTSLYSQARGNTRNVSRRGRRPSTSSRPSTSQEIDQTGSTSPNALAAVSAVPRVVTSPCKPVILSSQQCSVLLVREPNRPSSVLGSGPSSESSNVQTIVADPKENVLPKSTESKFIAADAPMVYTTANSSQIVTPSTITSSQPKTGIDSKPKATPASSKPKATTRQATVKAKVSDTQINTTVLTNVQTSDGTVILDLNETPSSCIDSTNFIIPANQTLTFHSDNTAVETPTSVGYTINIADILPPKPDSQGTSSINVVSSNPNVVTQAVATQVVTSQIVTPQIVTSQIGTPQMVTPQVVTSHMVTPQMCTPQIVTSQVVTPQVLQPLSTLTNGTQQLTQDMISVKPQSKMLAPQPIKLSAPLSAQTSYLQFQTSENSNDISVIPITILSGPGQEPVSLDQTFQNTQFLTQGLSQLVPFQTLSQQPAGTAGQLTELPVGVENATVESIDVVEVIDVAQENGTIRLTSSNIGDLQHGITRNVPDQFTTNFIQLTPGGTFPTMSSSQVTSVLTALEPSLLPQQQQQQQQLQGESNLLYQELTKPLPSPVKKPPPLKKGSRKLQEIAPKISELNLNESQTKSNEESNKANASNSIVDKVSCFKCPFCLFLTLDKNAVGKHIQEEHSSDLSQTREKNNVIPCPGCSNVFVSERSLSVHLSEDHKVAGSELSGIMSTLSNLREESTTEEDSPRKSKSPRLRRSLRASAKIRVRNLMKDTENEENQEPTMFGDQNQPDNSDDTFEEATEETMEESRSIRQTDHHDLEDHDYASLALDSSEVLNSEGNPRKRIRRKRGMNLRKKRRLNENGEKPRRVKKVGYKCNVHYCLVKMVSYDNLVYHQRCHGSEGEGIVNEETTEVGKSEDQDSSSQKSRKLEYACPECSMGFRTWLLMSGHLWRSHSIDMELYSCDVCDYKTPSKSNLVNLHRKIHGAERDFVCDICKKAFKTIKQLRNHRVIHLRRRKDEPDEETTCNLCSRRFADVRLLRGHISAVHNKVRPFMCQTCGYAASSKSTLKMHMRVHTGEKPFKCDECSYSTSDHNSLRRHKKRHSGDKPYKCPHCFYACIQSSTYKAHLRAKHPGQGEGLMFSCQNCTFHTVNQDIYKAHIAQHSGNSPVSAPKPKAAKVTKVSKSSKNPKKSPVTRKQPKLRIRPNTDGTSSHAVATAAVTEPLPIILSFSTEEVHASEAPNMHSVVDGVSEAIIPGSDLHLLYSNFAMQGFNQPQPVPTNTGVVYGTQPSDFMMSVIGNSVIQVVEGTNDEPPVVSITEECITGDLGQPQGSTQDLKFKQFEEGILS